MTSPKEKVIAKNKEHLKQLIEETIEKEGSNCDLNFIDVSNVTDMSKLFSRFPSNDDIDDLIELDVSNMTDMNEPPNFSKFNGDISKWDVSNVTNMRSMFSGSQFNGDISNWNISNVTDTGFMFDNSQFNGDISNWKVSNVTDMRSMFSGSKFNGDLSNWNVSNVTNMSYMFNESVFNNDISRWDVSKVTNMCRMFSYSQFNRDISKWDVSNVTDMSAMFSHSEFNGNIDKWNVSSSVNMGSSKPQYDEALFGESCHMFKDSALQKNENLPIWYNEEITARDKKHLKQIINETIKKNGINCNLNFIDVSNITDMSELFLLSYFNGDISKWNVSNVKNMKEMFCHSEFNGNISNWNVSNVKDMTAMFSDSKFNGDISKWHITDETNIHKMFENSQFNGSLDSWDIRDENKISSDMFCGSNFEKAGKIDSLMNIIRKRDLEKRKNLQGKIVATDTNDLKSLINKITLLEGFNSNLNIIDVSHISDMESLFENSQFNGDISEWNVSSVRNMSRMFANSLFNGDISKWRISANVFIRDMFKNSNLAQSNRIPDWYLRTIYATERIYNDTIFSRSYLTYDDLAQKLTQEPYKSEFIQFDPECNHTLVFDSESNYSVIYSKKSSSTEIGRVRISNNKIYEVSCNETIDNFSIKRLECYLKSGQLNKRRLLIYQNDRLIHFCFEIYKNNLLDFCATSINDKSISNGTGNYVRYIYNNGKICHKEIFSGTNYKYDFLGYNHMPPVIYSIGGNLEIRYTQDWNSIRKATNFTRFNDFPVIVSSKNGLEKIVDLYNVTSTHEQKSDLYEIMDDSACRVHWQEKLFKKHIESIKQKNDLKNSNLFIEYNINAEKLEETLCSLERGTNKTYHIVVHGHSGYYNLNRIFNNYLKEDDLHVNIDLSDCDSEEIGSINFQNCTALRWLALPSNMCGSIYRIFDNCPNLGYIKIPENISHVERGIFDKCRDFCFSIGVRKFRPECLIYSDEQLKIASDFEIESNGDLYNTTSLIYKDHPFDYLGYISLPKPYINGLILTDCGEDFRKCTNTNIYELNSLLKERLHLAENIFISKDHSSEFHNSITGFDAILKLKNNNNNLNFIWDKIVIDTVPVISYAWRTRYYENSILQNPYINILYEKLLNKIDYRCRNSYLPSSLLKNTDLEIQSILNELACNYTYKIAMWYLYTSGTKLS